MNEQHKMSISERRATFPLQERIRIYTPDTITRKKTKKLVIHGVNILNKSSLDSDTAMHRIKQRRETHNRVERRRRDNLNTLLNHLAELVPKTALEKNGCHRAKILSYAIEYIETIKQENQELRQRLSNK